MRRRKRGWVLGSLATPTAGPFRKTRGCPIAGRLSECLDFLVFILVLILVWKLPQETRIRTKMKTRKAERPFRLGLTAMGLCPVH